MSHSVVTPITTAAKPVTAPCVTPCPRVIAVVPTYNERANLPGLLSRLSDAGVPNLQTLIVDDNSPDGTGELAEHWADCYGETADSVSVLHRSGKGGLGSAYVDGMQRALQRGADIVVQLDADCSHPVAELPRMIGVLARTGAAVVVGSRYVTGGSVSAEWPWRRRMLSSWANRYVERVLGLHVTDATSGFKVWRAPMLDLIDLRTVRSNGYAFQVEMTYRAIRAGGRVAEVPIHFTDRTAGASKMSLGVQLESAVVPWRLRHEARRLTGTA